MADNDDFEIIDEIGLSNEQVFEFIDENDVTEKTMNNKKPTTPDAVLPLLVCKPLANEIPQIVQQQTPIPIVNTPEPHSSIQTTTVITSFVQNKKTISPPPPPLPIIFAPVPPLPKAPGLQRYGDAALIPHNLDEDLDIDSIINQAKRNLQNALNICTQEKQQQDIQKVLQQRRNLLNKK
jgi:hypothetical protein